jgi:putative NADPH-quinone reductase
MRALVVYCHPKPTSFTAAVRDVVMDRLAAAGAEVRLRDLYAEGFDPRLTAHDLDIYEDESRNGEAFAGEIADIRWCDTLIFVYPTWWYGLPAVLKGWLDRVLVPGLAFVMPEPGGTIKPGLTHIKGLAVFTTCGASWWLTTLVGAPGRRTITRGIGLLCAKGHRRAFAAHYLMDSSTDASRKAHLAKVAAKMDRFTGGPRRVREEATA